MSDNIINARTDFEIKYKELSLDRDTDGRYHKRYVENRWLGWLHGRKFYSESVAQKDEQIKVLREALEFYADKKNWETPEEQGYTTKHSPHLSEGVSDMLNGDSEIIGSIEISGKRAREALDKLRGMEK